MQLYKSLITNRVLSPILQYNSPYFHRFDTHLDLHKLKLFGSLCYASTILSYRTKLDDRARKYIYLGHEKRVKEVVLLYLNTKTIFQDM